MNQPTLAFGISFFLLTTAWGLKGVDWRGKRVVIAGMGAFAVENVSSAQRKGQANLKLRCVMVSGLGCLPITIANPATTIANPYVGMRIAYPLLNH